MEQKSVQIDQNPPGRIHRGTDRGAGISKQQRRTIYGGCKMSVDRSSLLVLPQKEKAKGNWRKWHYESPNNKYCSRNAIRVKEMGRECGTDGGIWKAKLEKTDQLELTGLLGRIILKQMFRKQNGMQWAGQDERRHMRWEILIAVVNLRVP